MYVFFYGTLMDRDVLKLVIGENIFARFVGEGELASHLRVYVKDMEYPGLVYDPGHSVRGVVFGPMSEEEIKRLNHFEGATCSFISGKIRMLTGPLAKAKSEGVIECHYYKESEAQGLTDQIWTLENWIKNHKKKYLQKTKRWMENMGSGVEIDWAQMAFED